MASIANDPNGRKRILFIGADCERRAVRLGKIPMKTADAVRAKIEAIVAAQTAKISIDKETAEWIGGLDDKLYRKLANVQLVPERAKPEKAILVL